MKFIENRDLTDLALYLTERNMGVYTVNGRFEAFDFKDDVSLEYTTSSLLTTSSSGAPKHIESATEGFDAPRSMRRSRSNSFGNNFIVRRPLRRRSSSLGDLSEPESQKLFIGLISALNDNYPDYDFQSAKSHQFVVEDVAIVMRRVNGYLAELNDTHSTLLTKLWQTIDLIVNLNACEIFAYVPSLNDSFLEGSLWSFNYFFFNKDTMQICYLTCVAQR